MEGRYCFRRLACAIAVALGVVGLIAAAAPASGAGSGGWTVQKSPDPGGSKNNNELLGAAATSATNAWAVGEYRTSHSIKPTRTVIERWNGKAWGLQKGLNPAGRGNYDSLEGVAAVSATDAWAVGWDRAGKKTATLIEHWNGKAWRVQKSPSPGAGVGPVLTGVAATSFRNAWAVGYASHGRTAVRPLIEHWNGKTWSVQPSPHPGRKPGPVLTAVAAISPTDAWAVGQYDNGTTLQTLIEHWDGTAWQVQPSPNLGGPSNANYLESVTATSATDAWAVGYYDNGTVNQTLIEHWNGKTWQVRKSPNPGASGSSDQLNGVVATSSTNAWAVGERNSTYHQTLVEHWNGKDWTWEPSPYPGGSLFAVAASGTDAWAVGYYYHRTADQTLIEHQG